MTTWGTVGMKVRRWLCVVQNGGGMYDNTVSAS